MSHDLGPRFAAPWVHDSGSLNVINTFRCRLFRHVLGGMTLESGPEPSLATPVSAPSSRSGWFRRRTSRAMLQVRYERDSLPPAHSTPTRRRWLIPTVY